ncbi:MAG: hypothetical protein Q4C55_08770 [Eubacterium sp.]|nr:hypothetical protein [Eubacterium sp.]
MNRIYKFKKEICMALVVCSMLCLSNLSIAKAESIEPYELNQWTRSSTNFEFNTQSRYDMEKTLYSSMSGAATVVVGKLFGVPGTVTAAALSPFISNTAENCMKNFYGRFGQTGYGTVIGARYQSKLRLAYYYYSDPGRKNLVTSYVFSTDAFPV